MLTFFKSFFQTTIPKRDARYHKYMITVALLFFVVAILSIFTLINFFITHNYPLSIVDSSIFFIAFGILFIPKKRKIVFLLHTLQ